MANRTCSIEGCERKHLARGWCGTHYTRWRSTGTTDLLPRMKDGLCSIGGCGRPAEKRGWCAAHYRRWRIDGDPLADKPVRPREYPVVNGRKQCRACGRWLPVEAFTARNRACGECTREYNRSFKEANPTYWQEWARANPDKTSAAVHNRRARIEGAESERIDRSVVFERDDFTCRLCGGPLDMASKWPAPWSPSIDHIVPLSLGGDHLYVNVQAAHFRCNTAKGARVAAVAT